MDLDGQRNILLQKLEDIEKAIKHKDKLKALKGVWVNFRMSGGKIVPAFIYNVEDDGKLNMYMSSCGSWEPCIENIVGAFTPESGNMYIFWNNNDIYNIRLGEFNGMAEGEKYMCWDDPYEYCAPIQTQYPCHLKS